MFEKVAFGFLKLFLNLFISVLNHCAHLLKDAQSLLSNRLVGYLHIDTSVVKPQARIEILAQLFKHFLLSFLEEVLLVLQHLLRNWQCSYGILVAILSLVSESHLLDQIDRVLPHFVK